MQAARAMPEGLRFGLSCLLLFAGVGGAGSGCSFDAGLDGAECSPSGATSEDGTRRCENGYWVAVDGTAADGGAVDGGRVDGDADSPDLGADLECDDPQTWYVDNDGDGAGDPEAPQVACTQPEGTVANSQDCDDSDATIRPDATEACDGVDNDCDGATDDGCDCTYDPEEPRSIDTDGNFESGVCTGQVIDQMGACEEPDAFETRADEESACDEKDNDCDGKTDEGCGCTYDPGESDSLDTDGSHADGICTDQELKPDGSCTEPAGFEDRTVEESKCNERDEDCDGVVDEGCACTYDPDEADDIDTDGSRDGGVCVGSTIDPDGRCGEPGDFGDPERSCGDGVDNDCDGETDEAWKDPGTPCNADCECLSGRCDSDSRCAHRMFVTSGTHDGNLGGLSGADAICQNAAQAAGLTGTWRAVLSDSSRDANARITLDADVVKLNNDRTRIAPLNDFWSNNHESEIDRNENGASITTCPANCNDDHVWTGTNADGTHRPPTCSDWSSAAASDDGASGDAGRSNRDWADDPDESCDTELHLYCIDGQ